MAKSTMRELLTPHKIISVASGSFAMLGRLLNNDLRPYVDAFNCLARAADEIEDLEDQIEKAATGVVPIAAFGETAGFENSEGIRVRVSAEEKSRYFDDYLRLLDGERPQHFMDARAFSQSLANKIDPERKERFVIENLEDVIHAYEGFEKWIKYGMRERIQQIIADMNAFQRVKIQTMPDYLAYCDVVAGQVAAFLHFLVTGKRGWGGLDEALSKKGSEIIPKQMGGPDMRGAYSAARAVQIVNMLRDVREDYDEGRFLLPAKLTEKRKSQLMEGGLEAEDVFEGGDVEEILRHNRVEANLSAHERRVLLTGLRKLIGVATREFRIGMNYTYDAYAIHKDYGKFYMAALAIYSQRMKKMHDNLGIFFDESAAEISALRKLSTFARVRFFPYSKQEFEGKFVKPHEDYLSQIRQE